MTKQKKALLDRLLVLWIRHDKLERQILALERKFTDKELDEVLER